MGRFVLGAIVVLMGSGCFAAAEPIDLAVMLGLLLVRTLSERSVDYKH